MNKEGGGWRRFPELQESFNYSIRQVVGIKYLGETASGKTMTVEVKRRAEKWNNVTSEYEPTIATHTVKTRTSNVEAFLGEVRYGLKHHLESKKLKLVDYPAS